MARYLTDCWQFPVELEWFIGLLKENEVKSYLEIGSRYGGSLWKIANALPKGSKIVAVDLPADDDSKDSLCACAAELQRRGYEVHTLLGNSRSSDIIGSVSRLAPFDVCFIDGDHTLDGVKSDYETYGRMASKMVAFHDISWRRKPEWKGRRIEVPLFWENIKSGRRHDECRSEPNNNGIGVLWQESDLEVNA